MSQFNDRNGGPAFPQPLIDMGGASGAVSADEMGAGGMSLRDYFAAKAMAEVLKAVFSAGGATERQDADPIARSAYHMADAMLKARAE